MGARTNTFALRLFLPAPVRRPACGRNLLGLHGTGAVIPAELHVEQFSWRPAFFSIIRLPAGRTAALRYAGKAQSKEPFPVGAQRDLIEQAFLISKEGE